MEIHHSLQMFCFLFVLLMAFTVSIMFQINNTFIAAGFVDFSSVMFLVKI